MINTHNVIKCMLLFEHLILIDQIQFAPNHLKKIRARIELYKLYTGPAFIHLVCIKLYFYFEMDATNKSLSIVAI